MNRYDIIDDGDGEQRKVPNESGQHVSAQDYALLQKKYADFYTYCEARLSAMQTENFALSQRIEALEKGK